MLFRSFNNLFSEAMAVHPKGVDIMKPGGLVKDPISALSLGLGLMFGTAGLPHILMRFFTVSDAREARKSVFYATGFMGYFYILTFIIGFGAIMLVGANPEYKDAAGHLIGGNNMAAVHLANPLDLIITGCQSSEGQNGQTPFLLAEMLGWPCFTQVERFTLDSGVLMTCGAYSCAPVFATNA